MQCDSCGIQIGTDYIEKTAYQVGRYWICGHCYGELIRNGHVELDGRKQVAGKGTICDWLYPDGSVKTMRFVLSDEARFVPLDEPIPEGLEAPLQENDSL